MLLSMIGKQNWILIVLVLLLFSTISVGLAFLTFRKEEANQLAFGFQKELTLSSYDDGITINLL